MTSSYITRGAGVYLTCIYYNTLRCWNIRLDLFDPFTLFKGSWRKAEQVCIDLQNYRISSQNLSGNQNLFQFKNQDRFRHPWCKASGRYLLNLCRKSNKECTVSGNLAIVLILLDYSLHNFAKKFCFKIDEPTQVCTFSGSAGYEKSGNTAVSNFQLLLLSSPFNPYFLSVSTTHKWTWQSHILILLN